MPFPTPRPLPLFVYGTLRPGASGFSRYLAAVATTIRQATARGRLWSHPDGDYPFLTPGNAIVRGEAVEITPAAWERVIGDLDDYEDYNPADEPGSLYLRRTIAARLPDGATALCWTYLWNRPDLAGTLIPSGDWFQQ